MTITAKIVLDSISPHKIRLTTFQLRYPRFIHAEFMTHRVFSRNASSSRAVPVKKVISDIREDPAMPIHWGRNQSGMQAETELSGFRLWAMRTLWLTGMWIMTSIALLGARAGAHKQLVNRLIEPWSHISVVVSSTDYENFFALRRHKDAQPEIKKLADLMHQARRKSLPKALMPGEWHLPYVTEAEKAVDLLLAKKMSVARTARVSYETHDNKAPTADKDRGLYERLVGSVPLHASPAEHQATPDSMIKTSRGMVWRHPELHGNLRGYIQFRKTLVNESHPELPVL